MRTFLENSVKRRPRDRHRSRFSKQNRISGGGKLIRFRRNRELMIKEAFSAGLWMLLALMLVNLAGTLDGFSRKHLMDHSRLLQLCFPALSIAAAAACVWRGQKSIREILDIRKEQKALQADLQELSRGSNS